MATGAAHYRAAEELIEKAAETVSRAWSGGLTSEESRWTPHARAALLAEAQAHATLALAAATIEPLVFSLAPGEGTDERILVEWAEVTSA